MPESSPRRLRLLLDTAAINQWERFLPLGIIHGVTTNPLLLERAHLDCRLPVLADLATRAAALGAKEIHLQTWGETVEEMVNRGREIAKLKQVGIRILTKVPATGEGLETARILQDEGAEITLTAVFNQGQVMAAAALGAAYVAPYLGRMQDAGRDGMTEIRAMQDILLKTASPTRLLTASLRRANQVAELASSGVDTFTMGPQVLADLLYDELTETAVADFGRAATRK